MLTIYKNENYSSGPKNFEAIKALMKERGRRDKEIIFVFDSNTIPYEMFFEDVKNRIFYPNLLYIVSEYYEDVEGFIINNIANKYNNTKVNIVLPRLEDYKKYDSLKLNDRWFSQFCRKIIQLSNSPNLFVFVKNDYPELFADAEHIIHTDLVE